MTEFNRRDWAFAFMICTVCIFIFLLIATISTMIFTGPIERVNLKRIDLKDGFVYAYWIMYDGRISCATFNSKNVFVGPETRLIVEHESGLLFIPGSDIPISLELTGYDMAVLLSNGTVFA